MVFEIVGRGGVYDLNKRDDQKWNGASAGAGQGYRRRASVMITFIDDEAPIPVKTNGGSKSLEALIAECQVDTGITDLASQHDHYLYGTPKR